MQLQCTERTSKFIKSLALIKIEELWQCKKKIKTLEKTLQYNHNEIDLYKYRQANQRIDNLKFTILNLKALEIKMNQKF